VKQKCAKFKLDLFDLKTARTMTSIEIKTMQKSNTFSSLASGGQRLGTWFDRRARKISMKCSKSITLGMY